MNIQAPSHPYEKENVSCLPSLMWVCWLILMEMDTLNSCSYHLYYVVNILIHSHVGRIHECDTIPYSGLS